MKKTENSKVKAFFGLWGKRPRRPMNVFPAVSSKQTSAQGSCYVTNKLCGTTEGAHVSAWLRTWLGPRQATSSSRSYFTLLKDASAQCQSPKIPFHTI